jgi:hypothetical protein
MLLEGFGRAPTGLLRLIETLGLSHPLVIFRAAITRSTP